MCVCERERERERVVLEVNINFAVKKKDCYNQLHLITHSMRELK